MNIPAVASLVEGRNGLPMVRVATPHATGEMYLHGGHVTSWKPAGHDEVLFVSEDARYEDGKAIRGGVPVCFPWFGALEGHPYAPSHGCVRTRTWRLDSIEANDDAAVVTMSTESDQDTRRFWPADFLIEHRVTFGAELTMELTVTNTGDGPLTFEEALHTYYRVGHVASVRIEGLAGVRYLDSVDDNREKVQAGDIAFVGETDRIYLDTGAPIELLDGVGARRLRIAAHDARTTVVWNPWIGRAQAFTDMRDDEWREFVCIETCNVTPAAAVTLAPGDQHLMRAIVTIQR